MVTIRKILTVASAVACVIFFPMYVLAKQINVVRHSLVVGNPTAKQKKLTVFFISDIHRRYITKKLLTKVGTHVDFVLIGGDLAEGGVPPSRIESNVHMLSQLGPVYYIWGNNDREVGEDVIRTILRKYGAILLENCCHPVPGHQKWGICGTDDSSSRKADLPATTSTIAHYQYHIFATHSPQYFKKVREVFIPELLLAGHTHGGQIRLGKYGMFDIGAYRSSDGKAELVSNGYGTSIVPLRFGAKPECHVIEISYPDDN